MENSDRTTLNPKEESVKNLLKKTQRPVDEEKLKDTSGILFWRSVGRGGEGWVEDDISLHKLYKDARGQFF